MQRSEFAERTKTFLSKEEIDRYEVDYEPAYMECNQIDKDDFCSILKDKTVRKLVVMFSEYVLCARAREKDAARCFKDMLARRDIAAAKADALRKSISLIQSVCDRILAEEGKSVP